MGFVAGKKRFFSRVSDTGIASGIWRDFSLGIMPSLLVG
jgi:hypothetical protein